MTRRISVETTLAIHGLTIERHGGTPGVRDMGMLESALAAPFQTFAGQDLHPTLDEKAAALAYGLAMDHPFLDGNKRVAAAVLAVFLRDNGRTFRPSHAELERVILGVAAGEVGRDELVSWVGRQP